jgi:hypothetical protein
MKKVSTVAAEASKKISQQKLTVGLDLGDRNSPKIVYETRSSETTTAVTRWDEKAGLRRDAVYAPKLSTCARHR